MAGVKGMKGSGGARPGAGRKPAPKLHALAKIVVAQAAEVAAQGAGVSQPTPPAEPIVIEDPMQWLLAAMKNPALDDKLRIDAAKALLPFLHAKKADAGVKDEKAERAKKAGAGKFAAAAAPLRMVK